MYVEGTGAANFPTMVWQDSAAGGAAQGRTGQQGAGEVGQA